ncbi:MAG TPA: GNAT family N-acetyltransferase [Candidatus Nanoarchaeia archaeon]|nr:GNAT family N-acetyltransferase [Candidatus Nanoarchaeia archaeon]
MLREERLAYTDFKNPVKIPTSLPGLLLRQYVPGDAEAIHRLMHASRDHLRTSGEDIAGKYPTLDDMLHSIVHPQDPFKLRTGIWHDDVLVGGANLIPFCDDKTAEIGYWLGKEHTGKGYMTHAVVALTGHAFELGFEEVLAFIMSTNDASAKVLLRAGYAEVESQRGKRAFSRRSL